MSKRTIVIAGGAHGIGLAVARAAAAQGDEAIKPTVLESPFADTPLTPEDVSVVIMHELDQPAHVSTHDIVLVPTRQGWA